jgi:hypothetical protein
VCVCVFVCVYCIYILHTHTHTHTHIQYTHTHRYVQEEQVLVPYLEGLKARAARWCAQWEAAAAARRQKRWRRALTSGTKLALNVLDAASYVASTSTESAGEQTASMLPACAALEEFAAILCSAHYCQRALEDLGDSELYLALSSCLVTQQVRRSIAECQHKLNPKP